jgi:hypothetical protein
MNDQSKDAAPVKKRKQDTQTDSQRYKMQKHAVSTQTSRDLQYGPKSPGSSSSGEVFDGLGDNESAEESDPLETASDHSPVKGKERVPNPNYQTQLDVS